MSKNNKYESQISTKYKNSHFRELTKEIVKRAEKAGFKALVLTVDANVFGLRYADLRNGFRLPPHLK